MCVCVHARAHMHTLAIRLRKSMENHDVASQFQSGFVSGWRTMSIFAIKTTIDKYSIKDLREQECPGALLSVKGHLI